MRAGGSRAVLLLSSALTLATCATADEAGPFRHLLGAPSGAPFRVATTDKSGKNNDFVSLPPGQTLTLVDVAGPAILRHVWMTVRPRDRVEVLRGLVIRAYWDGERDPSVEAPLDDFFGVGFGERAEVTSLLVTQLSGGMNCYWPMPFRERALITITNYGSVTVDAVYAHFDLVHVPSVASDEPYFHAHWHRAHTAEESPYVILDTRGRGMYVGTVLSMQNLAHRSLFFLEGNDVFQVDDEPTPSLEGTGTEDYFLAGWYFDRGPFSAPLYGATVVDGARGRASAFRWHVFDPVSYRQHLRVTIEDGLKFSPLSGNQPRSDYSSVALYYQREPHDVHSTISSWSDVAPIAVAAPPPAPPGTLEVERLMDQGTVSRGAYQIEQLGFFEGPTFSGNAYVAWGGAEIGAELHLPITVVKAGAFRVEAWVGRAGDGVLADVFVDDQRVGGLSFFRPGPTWKVAPEGPIDVGVAHLDSGPHTLRFKVTGTDAQMTSPDRFVYLDAVAIRAIGDGR
jgi:hypothetical protein